MRLIIAATCYHGCNLLYMSWIASLTWTARAHSLPQLKRIGHPSASMIHAIRMIKFAVECTALPYNAGVDCAGTIPGCTASRWEHI